MRLLAALFLLSACPATPPKPDAGPIDAGPDAITVEVATRFIQVDGAVFVQPADLRTRTITVYLEGDGGFDIISVLGNADGTFVVPDVRGRYLAQVGELLISTTARHLTLGENVAGRPEVFVVKPREGLNLTATNLAPWTADDELQLVSWAAGIEYFSTAQRRGAFKANGPDAGDTSLQSAIIDMEGSQVVEASKGDDFRVLQLSAQKLDGGGEWKTLTRAASLSVDLALGGPTPVTTSLETVPQQAVTVRYDARSFEEAALAVHPNATAFETRWLLDAHLGTFGPNAITTGSPDLAMLRLPPDAGTVSLAMTYGNPFPSNWTPFVTVGAAFDVLFSAPLPDGGLSPARSEVAAISRVTTFEQAQSMTLDAPITPIRGVKLDGASIDEGFPSVAYVPELSWQPPARGTVSRVDIDVVELVAGSVTRRVQGPTISVVGDVNHLRLPPGYLKPGATEFLRVTAVMQPQNWNAEAPLFAVGPPAAAATTLTRAFNVRP